MPLQDIRIHENELYEISTGKFSGPLETSNGELALVRAGDIHTIHELLKTKGADFPTSPGYTELYLEHPETLHIPKTYKEASRPEFYHVLTSTVVEEINGVWIVRHGIGEGSPYSSFPLPSGLGFNHESFDSWFRNREYQSFLTYILFKDQNLLRRFLNSEGHESHARTSELYTYPLENGNRTYVVGRGNFLFNVMFIPVGSSVSLYVRAKYRVLTEDQIPKGQSVTEIIAQPERQMQAPETAESSMDTKVVDKPQVEMPTMEQIRRELLSQLLSGLTEVLDERYRPLEQSVEDLKKGVGELGQKVDEATKKQPEQPRELSTEALEGIKDIVQENYVPLQKSIGNIRTTMEGYEQIVEGLEQQQADIAAKRLELSPEARGEIRREVYEQVTEDLKDLVAQQPKRELPSGAPEELKAIEKQTYKPQFDITLASPARDSESWLKTHPEIDRSKYTISFNLAYTARHDQGDRTLGYKISKFFGGMLSKLSGKRIDFGILDRKDEEADVAGVGYNDGLLFMERELGLPNPNPDISDNIHALIQEYNGKDPDFVEELREHLEISKEAEILVNMYFSAAYVQRGYDKRRAKIQTNWFIASGATTTNLREGRKRIAQAPPLEGLRKL